METYFKRFFIFIWPQSELLPLVYNILSNLFANFEGEYRIENEKKQKLCDGKASSHYPVENNSIFKNRK